jgi:hypothetical protein
MKLEPKRPSGLRDLRLAGISKLDMKIEGGKVVAYRIGQPSYVGGSACRTTVPPSSNVNTRLHAR